MPTSRDIANKLRGFALEEDSAKKWEGYLRKDSSYPSSSIRMENESFSSCDFTGFKFANFHFHDTNFENTIFTDAEFEGCSISFSVQSRMEGCHLDVKFMRGSTLSGLDLTNVILKGAEFSNCAFQAATLHKNKVEGSKFIDSCDFTNATISNVKFEDCDINGAIFKDATLEATSFKLERIKDVIFSDVTYTGGDFKVAKVCSCNFSNAVIESVKIEGGHFFDSKLNGVDFTNIKGKKLTASMFSLCDMSNTNFTGVVFEDGAFNDTISEGGERHLGKMLLDSANFSDAIFLNTEMYGVQALGAKFINADLRDVSFYRCGLTGSDFSKCKISKHTLETLGDQGVTRSDELAMDITDDLAKLRLQFSGFWTMLHLTALTLFLTPYVWFVVRYWPIASFGNASVDGYIPLWKALFLYIYNGGENLADGEFVRHPSSFIFCLLLLFNIVRATLLFRTKTLEHKAEITGTPSRFSYQDKVRYLPFLTWGGLALINTWLLVFNAAFSLGSFCYFMTRAIPLASL